MDSLDLYSINMDESHYGIRQGKNILSTGNFGKVN